MCRFSNKFVCRFEPTTRAVHEGFRYVLYGDGTGFLDNVTGRECYAQSVKWTVVVDGNTVSAKAHLSFRIVLWLLCKGTTPLMFCADLPVHVFLPIHVEGIFLALLTTHPIWVSAGGMKYQDGECVMLNAR